MKIDHIGYAVRNMGFAISVFELLGYTFQETRIDDARKVKVKIGILDATRIKLLSPIGGGVEYKFAKAKEKKWKVKNL